MNSVWTFGFLKSESQLWLCEGCRTSEAALGRLALRWFFHSLLFDLQSDSFSHLRWKGGLGGWGEGHIWDDVALYLAFTRIKSMWELQPIAGEESGQRQETEENVHSYSSSVQTHRDIQTKAARKYSLSTPCLSLALPLCVFPFPILPFLKYVEPVRLENGGNAPKYTPDTKSKWHCSWWFLL